jgi:transglutaminase-like putative cysteine protease
MNCTQRKIDQRKIPRVKGIDLVQSMNYIKVEDVGTNFAYDNYTSSMIFYRQESRPLLEKIVNKITDDKQAQLDKVRAVTDYVSNEIKWAGYFKADTGEELPADLALSEEEIIARGYGWCNEQARVFCCLTQIAGITSRMVFAKNSQRQYGHAVSEVLLPNGWMLVDQSHNFCFIKDDEPVRGVDVYNDPQCRAYFADIYKKLMEEVRQQLPKSAYSRPGAGNSNDEGMIGSQTPLDGFKEIGVYNYFIT